MADAKKPTVHIQALSDKAFEKKDAQFILLNRIGFYEYLKRTTFKRSISRVQNHHTFSPDYSCFNGDDHFDDLKAMDKYHEEHNHWSDIGQNITIFPDGLIGICRPFDKTPAGIKGANTGSLCIESYGNFDEGGDDMTEAQRDSVLFVNAALCNRFNITPTTDTIIYHHWWNWSWKRTNGLDGHSKSCPGTNFFGGNTVEDCENNFLPLVNDKLDLLKSIKE